MSSLYCIAPSYERLRADVLAVALRDYRRAALKAIKLNNGVETEELQEAESWFFKPIYKIWSDEDPRAVVDFLHRWYKQALKTYQQKNS